VPPGARGQVGFISWGRSVSLRGRIQALIHRYLLVIPY
jgi:hypothetical protein